MPTLKFRFDTECQMTISGDSYEEAYLKFKDFMHGEFPVTGEPGLEVYPPEQSTVYFEVDDQQDYSTITRFKGDFVEDIVRNAPEELRQRMAHPPRVS